MSHRILIVDDESVIRLLSRGVLEGHGHSVVEAADVPEARLQLAGATFDLVLCDVNMPGESGIDFTREVLAQYPDTAVVMVTGMDDRRYADIAIELGAYGYILKPFKPNELIINVGNALRRRALEIDLLALRAAEPFADAAQQLRATRTEITEHDWNARWTRIDRGENSPFESGTRRGEGFVCGHR